MQRMGWIWFLQRTHGAAEARFPGLRIETWGTGVRGSRYFAVHREADKSDGHERFRGGVLGEHLLDPSYRLAGALFIFDQGEAHVAVAVVAEADAGD